MACSLIFVTLATLLIKGLHCYAVSVSIGLHASPVQPLENLLDFHQIWCHHYATGDNSNIILRNCLRLVTLALVLWML